jgi:hypothetical protein
MEEFNGAEEFLSSLRNASVHGRRYGPWASQLDRWKARLR